MAELADQLPPWRKAERRILEMARRCYTSRDQRAAMFACAKNWVKDFREGK